MIVFLAERRSFRRTEKAGGPRTLPALPLHVGRHNAFQEPQAKRKNHGIVQMPDDRNEVRDEIDGTQCIGDESARKPFRRARRAGMRHDQPDEAHFCRNPVSEAHISM